jgi:MATE family multidrug resistance protein
VQGVAAASVISEYAAISAGLLLCIRILRREGTKPSKQQLWDITRFRRLAMINGDIFVRTFFLISAFAIFTAQSAKFGDTTLAANALLLNFQMFLSHALDGFAHAASALVGGAAGTHDRAAFRRAAVITTVWAAATAGTFMLAYLLAGHLLVDILTSMPDVRKESYIYLPWLILSPLISVWSFQLDGVYIGATETGLMRNMMVISFIGYAGSLVVLLPIYSNHGLWAALMLFMFFRGVTLSLTYPMIEKRISTVT